MNTPSFDRSRIEENRPISPRKSPHDIQVEESFGDKSPHDIQVEESSIPPAPLPIRSSNDIQVEDNPIPEKAVKLALRLPSYLKSLEKSHENYHDNCKRKYSSNQLLNRQNTSLIHDTISKAKFLISKGDYLKATELCENLIQQKYLHSDLFYLAGESRRLLEDYEISERHLLSSISMQIHSPYAYFSLAMVYQAKNRYNEAIGIFRHFLTLVDNADGHYELARCFSSLGEHREAILHFTLCLERLQYQKIDPAIYILRAESYEKINRPDLAKLDYKKIFEISPNFHIPYLSHAQHLEENGNIREANDIRFFINKLLQP